MKIRLITIGKVRQSFLKEAEDEYLKRLTSKWKVEFVELEPTVANSVSDLERKRIEATHILGKLKESDFVVALEERGDEMSSPALAKWFEQQMNKGRSQITFIIGGAAGFDDSIRNRAQQLLSLSQLTFPHQFARVLLIEQLYRVQSILSGGPYHK